MDRRRATSQKKSNARCEFFFLCNRKKCFEWVLVSGEKTKRIVVCVIKFRMLENPETRSHFTAIDNEVSIINGDVLKDSRVCSLTEESFTGLSMSHSNGAPY